MDIVGTAAWGAVATLSFLILAVAYRALADGGPSLLTLFGVAVVVGVAGAFGARIVAR
ncbi:hypothetical protein [Halarchaeum salinum]|uniref:DUF7981 domain-containing protein n=1 Tax=Halarchaeum salinum TaxID=489912 RepID=A0AAV3SAH3_9EURY